MWRSAPGDGSRCDARVGEPDVIPPDSADARSESLKPEDMGLCVVAEVNGESGTAVL